MTALTILAVILALAGVLGGIIPGIPGPPLSWAGLLLVYIKNPDETGLAALLIWLGIVAAVTILDYIVPAYLTKAAGGHKAAGIGATLGLFAGMFLTPIGMIGGSLLGAFLGEFLIENGGVWSSFKASLGAFLGFIATTIMKLAVSGILLYRIITILFL